MGIVERTHQGFVIIKVGGIDADQSRVTVVTVTAKAAQIGNIGVLRVNGQGKIEVAIIIVGDRVRDGVSPLTAPGWTGMASL